jgi:hypothetical protein
MPIVQAGSLNTTALVVPHGCSTLMGRVSESGLQHRRIEVKRLLRKRIPESAYV